MALPTFKLGLLMTVLYLVVNLTISVMNYNPEMERALREDFLFCWKWVNAVIVWTFEVGRHL